MPFLRGSLWLKMLLCLDLWKQYRKPWEMQVSIITWLKSCHKKKHICPTLISSPLQLLLPTNYSKSNWENKCHILYDSITFIWFVVFVMVCHRHREKAHVGTPSGQQRGRHRGGLPNWMKRGWRLQCVATVSFWKLLICTGGRYLPTLCIFRRSSCQPRLNFLQWMWLANIGHTWRKLLVSFLLFRIWPQWSLSSVWCMLEPMLLSVKYV